METVVDEKPLSFATSRIVTVASFIASFSPLDRIAVKSSWLEFVLLLADTTAESETSVKFEYAIFAGVPCRSPHRSRAIPIECTSNPAIDSGAKR